MKRHLIYFLGALLAFTAFGCSSDDVAQRGDIDLTIQLTMASEMNTRGARQLEGVDNWQHVTAVRVYVFRADEPNGEFSLYQPTVNNEAGVEQKIEYIDVKEFYKEADAIYKEKDYEKHTVIIKPQLPDGYYRLLAIGVDEDEDLFKIINADSKLDAILKTFDESPVTDEFFSGLSETVHVSSSIDKTFISIELKRCVAGVLLYVKNFPNDITDIKLILSGYSHTTDIVNRTWKTDAVESDIELVNINKDDVDEDHNENINGEELFYYGKFIIPSRTAKLTNPTMKLVYYKGENEVKSKDVVLISASDNNYGDMDLDLDEKGKHYNILANHIYCIGFRSEEKKEPIDLSEESDEVKIIAYGSWQADVDITL